MINEDFMLGFKPQRATIPHVSVTKRKPVKMLNPKLSLNINDKNVLSKYIAAELDLYNAYVESLTAAVNRKPDNFYDITLEQSHLFSELCVAGISIDEAKKDQRFQNSKEILNSIPESVKIIFEIAKIKSQTLNFTKKNMSLELLNFFIDYCLMTRSKKSLGMQTLNKQSLYQKRHIQIPRKLCKIIHDEKTNTSSLYIPHLKNPVCKVVGTNLNKHNWSIVIIHQKTNVNPDVNTDWYAEFKPSKYEYIVKYLDKKW